MLGLARRDHPLNFAALPGQVHPLRPREREQKLVPWWRKALTHTGLEFFALEQPWYSERGL